MAWTLGSDHRTMSDSLRVLLSLKANNNCTKSTPKPFWIRLLVIIPLERDTIYFQFFQELIGNYIYMEEYFMRETVMKVRYLSISLDSLTSFLSVLKSLSSFIFWAVFFLVDYTNSGLNVNQGFCTCYSFSL